MRPNNIYTTVQVRKDINKHIKAFCKKHNVSASSITEFMWTNYISSSLHLKEIMTFTEPAKVLLLSSSMSGSIVKSLT